MPNADIAHVRSMYQEYLKGRITLDHLLEVSEAAIARRAAEQAQQQAER